MWEILKEYKMRIMSTSQEATSMTNSFEKKRFERNIFVKTQKNKKDLVSGLNNKLDRIEQGISDLGTGS